MKKKLFVHLLAGSMTVGMAPAAAFAAGKIPERYTRQKHRLQTRIQKHQMTERSG